MGISKQIGWSTEANLYYQISQQLDQLIKITSRSIVSYYSVDSCERMASHVIAYHGANTLPVGTIVKNGTPECFYITGQSSGPADVGFVESFWGMNDCTACVNTRKFLRISWNDINDATVMIGGDVNDVSVWNNFFNLPIEGSPFFSVLVDGGIVILNNTGTMAINTPFSVATFSIADQNVVTSLGHRQVFYKTGITDISLNICTSIDDSSFYTADKLISVTLPSLVSVGVGAFEACTAQTAFVFPLATTIGNQAFSGCTSATTFMLPSVTSLGEDVLDNAVFAGIANQTITLTIPSALMTCNSGDPDGDITALQLSGNAVTIIEV